MFSKIEVNGEGACPLYRSLTAAAPEADGKADIPWNFTKFLIDRDGNVVGRWAPTVAPEDLVPEIERLLG